MRLLLALLVLALLPACRGEAEPACQDMSFDSQPFTVCRANARDASNIRLVLTHPDGVPVGQFDRLAGLAGDSGGEVLFAMNAGMYHEDRRPVGLYVEDGVEIAPLVTRAGPGNFGMVPNGVFWIGTDGTAHVTETLAYKALGIAPAYATQSGPMLVTGGELHPDFNENGQSRKRRNGVGLSADGETIYFAISNSPVNFHTFARLFRDGLDTPEALYLDGTVSRLYSAELGRSEPGIDMGPIVAVFASGSSN